MPIKLGTQNIGNVKIGNSQIAKVMLGTQLIWENAMGPQVIIDTSRSWSHDLGNPSGGSHDTVHTLVIPFSLPNKANSLLVGMRGTLGGIHCDATSRIRLTVLLDGVRISNQVTLGEGWNETGTGSGYYEVGGIVSANKGNHYMTCEFSTQGNNGMYAFCDGNWSSSPTYIYIAVQ